MKIRKTLNEVVISSDNDPEINKLFNSALEQVFSNQFLRKIDRIIKNSIEIKTIEDEENTVAYNQGNKIFLNSKVFFNYDKSAQIRYILHEFVHILQRKQGIFFKKFKDIKKFSIELYKIIKEYSKHPPSVFLTGQNQDLGSGGKWEGLSYFMNNSIHWSKINEIGKHKIINLFKKSKIFNLRSKFWKRRLPNI